MIPEEYRQYEDTVTLGCVNYDSIWNDKAASIGKIKKLIGEAAEQGINILVFPELSLSGYESNEGNTMHREFAETIPGPVTEEVAQLTRKLDTYVILGMPERDPDDAGTCYISCPLLGPEGLVGNYRKLHLGTPPLFRESLCFTGGDSVPVFETRYGPIGIQICADFWVYPELSRILMLKGARIIINSTASMNMPGRPFYITSMTAARATENLVYAASANLVGKENYLVLLRLQHHRRTGVSPLFQYLRAGGRQGRDHQRHIEFCQVAPLSGGSIAGQAQAVRRHTERI